MFIRRAARIRRFPNDTSLPSRYVSCKEYPAALSARTITRVALRVVVASFADAVGPLTFSNILFLLRLMRGRLLCLVACIGLLQVPAAAVAREVTPGALRAAYAEVQQVTAEIEQTKSSPFLFRPLVSRIHMEYGNGRVLWRVTEPVRGELVFDNGRVSGDSAAPLSSGAAEILAPLTRLFRAVFSFDFAALGQDFDLVFSANVLEARTRAGSELAFVKRLVFRFNPDLSPASVAVETGDETTELKFLRFETSPKATP